MGIIQAKEKCHWNLPTHIILKIILYEMEFLKECYKKMNLQVIQLLISHQTFEINIKSVNTACFKKSRISSVRERESLVLWELNLQLID